MDPAREVHWQQRWAEAGLARARRSPGQAKFYALVAYPGSSGFLHLGHLRGMAIADALHRFHRMRGRQVFFPTGTHASGLPSVAFAQRVQERAPEVLAQLRAEGVPPEAWPALEDPERAARFLGESYLRVFRRFGLLIDESAYVTTIDEDYRAFIAWQFRRLHDHGVLRQGPYFASVCPVCGPVSVDPSETDLATGGDAETIHYTTVPFPLDDGRVLLAATLRPETVYGVTNVWIGPAEPLVVWHHGGKPYLVGRTGGARLVEQHGGQLGHEVRPEELLGRTVSAPFTGATVPILSSPLVDPRQGTAVVMSVPAHAPADWVARERLRPEDRALVPSAPEIIFVPPDAPLTESEKALLAGTGVPAERAARATGAKTLEDTDALAAATDRLYRLEFGRGRMLVPALGPISVAEARERMARTLEAAGTGFTLQEFSKEVRCRNGHEVVIRRVPDQWFLAYGEADWKRRTHELLGRMRIAPAEYARELPAIIDWYADRPATRRGRWLGTPLPFDPSWTIEPIADSTFYPAYFILRRYVRDGRIPLAALTDALFDRAFLGTGPGEPTVDAALQAELREEFTYWYPLDLNLAGKEHKRVHFPVFLFTHALLLPPELQPRGLAVYWWLVSPEGAKLSKKEIGQKGGGVPTVADAFSTYGADAFRLFYATAASVNQDIEWDPALIERAADRLAEVGRMVRDALADGPGGTPELDAWLEDTVHDLLRQVVADFESGELRGAAQAIYIDLPQRIRRYFVRGGAAGPALARLADRWIRLLAPITPHLAEELGEGRFSSLVASTPFPDPAEFAENPVARARESYLAGVEEDLQSVLRPAAHRGEAPTGAIFYVAAPWKREVERWVHGSGRTGSELIREVMERAGRHPELASARGTVAEYVRRIAPKSRGEAGGPAPAIELDEVAILHASAGYLARRFRFAEVAVHREEEAEPFDPAHRRERARPGRPAFFLVHPVAASGGGGVTGRRDAEPKGPTPAPD